MYDVLIVGSGVVGAATALRLAKETTLSIAVIEAKPAQMVPLREARVSAISLCSAQFFDEIGVWQSIKEKRVSPYQTMYVWDAQGSGHIQFDAASIAESALGYIIEDQVIRQSLLEQFVSYPTITFLCPTTCHAINEQNDHIELKTTESGTIRARLVIAADGAESWVRHALGFQLNKKAYEHTAIVATVETEYAHQKTAWQRFMPEGPLAFLPLSDPHLCSIVWSTNPDHAKQLMALDSTVFTVELEKAFAHRLGAIRSVSARQAFPLTMRHVKNYVKARIALLGDAAHTIHPLAGLGVNMGLFDAKVLCQVITDAWKKNRDFASLQTLRRYERSRKGDVVLMLAIVQGLKQLFAQSSPIVQSMRNVGLNCVNRLPIKKWLIEYATGRHRLG